MGLKYFLACAFMSLKTEGLVVEITKQCSNFNLERSPQKSEYAESHLETTFADRKNEVRYKIPLSYNLYCFKTWFANAYV